MNNARISNARALWTLAAATTAAVIAACSSNGAASSESSPTTPNAGAANAVLPCDVDAVIAKNCRSCHGAEPQYGAPMPLVTLADFQAPAKNDPNKKVYELLSTRIHDATRPMPPIGTPKPSTAELDVLDAWVAASAPASTVACTGPTPPNAVTTAALVCPAGSTLQRIRPTKKHLMGNVADQYTCYGIAADALRGDGSTEKRHTVALGPYIDNPKIVHHILLFEGDAAPSDGAYAGTEEVPCTGAGGNNRLLAAWAPGGGAFVLPPDVGFPQTGATRYFVQVHLNNLAGLVGEEDGTGYDLCVGAERKYDADVMATGTALISIPPRSNTQTTCETTWNNDAIKVFGSFPHMHKLGSNLSLKRQSVGGTSENVIDAPTFDFFTGAVGVNLDLDVAKGDTFKTQCGWKNVSDTAVRFGEKTDDEMCFGFMLYYPSARLKTWAQPALVSKCTSESSPL